MWLKPKGVAAKGQQPDVVQPNMGAAGPKGLSIGEPNMDAVVSAVFAAAVLWLLGCVAGLM